MKSPSTKLVQPADRVIMTMREKQSVNLSDAMLLIVLQRSLRERDAAVDENSPSRRCQVMKRTASPDSLE